MAFSAFAITSWGQAALMVMVPEITFVDCGELLGELVGIYGLGGVGVLGGEDGLGEGLYV